MGQGEGIEELPEGMMMTCKNGTWLFGKQQP
jgi:hypothetical protein